MILYPFKIDNERADLPVDDRFRVQKPIIIYAPDDIQAVRLFRLAYPGLSVTKVENMQWQGQ